MLWRKRTVKRAWQGHVGGVSILNINGSLMNERFQQVLGIWKEDESC